MSSRFSLPDACRLVNLRTPNRPPGRDAGPLASVRRQYARMSPGELARTADAFSLAPPALRPDIWPHLVAVALEASEHLLAISIADGQDGAAAVDEPQAVAS